MTVKFTPVPFYAGNLTDAELARHVDHHYPHLQGPLLEVLKRFSTGRTVRDAERAAPVPVTEQSCPHCGSTYELEGSES